MFPCKETLFCLEFACRDLVATPDLGVFLTRVTPGVTLVESPGFVEVYKDFIEISGFWQPLVVALGIHARSRGLYISLKIPTGFPEFEVDGDSWPDPARILHPCTGMENPGRIGPGISIHLKFRKSGRNFQRNVQSPAPGMNP